MTIRVGVDTAWMDERPAGVGAVGVEVLRVLEARDDVELVRFSRRRGLWWRFFGLPREIEKAGLDVFWQVGGWLPLKKLRGVISVQTVHDLIIYDHPEWFSQSWFSRFWSLRIRVPRAILNADLVHCVSYWTSDACLRLFDVAGKVVVAHEGVLSSRLGSCEVECCGEIVGDDNVWDDNGGLGRFALMLGTLEPRKNIKGGVEAFLRYLELSGDEDMVLVVAGKVGWKADESLIAIRDGGEKIIFLDYVSESLKRELLIRTTVLLFTSFEEGFGRPLLEAMQVATPVVANASSAIVEVVGDAGVLVDALDVDSVARGIEYAVLHSDELGLKGKKRFEAFSVCKMVDTVLEEALKRNY